MSSPEATNLPTGSSITDSPTSGLNWKAWSAAMGTATLPLLRQLSESIPATTKLALCTPDGINICALGADRDIIGKFTILGSRLFKVSETLCSLDGHDIAMSDASVTVTENDTHNVLVGVDAGAHGLLILAASVAGSNPLGSVLAQVKKTKMELQQLPEMASQPSY